MCDYVTVVHYVITHYITITLSVRNIPEEHAFLGGRVLSVFIMNEAPSNRQRTFNEEGNQRQDPLLVSTSPA